MRNQRVCIATKRNGKCNPMNKEVTVFECEKTKKDYSISCARFVGMCFVVVCHLMQREGFSSWFNGIHIEWAFWFNVGVQMFLFISGFLYGKKDKIEAVGFYKKSFPKLLVDYYVFIVLMLILISLSSLMSVDKYDVLNLLTFSGTVDGLVHLWFVPTILFCYLLVPVYSEIVNSINKHGNLRFVVESVLLLLIVHMVVWRFFVFFIPAWINCYVIGMLYSKIEQRQTLKHAFYIVAIASCVIIISIQFAFDYFIYGDLSEFNSSNISSFTQYGHVFLGIVLIILIRFIYDKLGTIVRNHFVLDWSDKYSYDVYLVHHVFILSAFGCVEFISNRWVAIPLAIVLTIFSSMLLNAVSTLIRNKSFLIIRRIHKQL